MIVVTNRLSVTPGREEEFEERFKQRAHLVEKHEGFIRNEVHRPRPVRYERGAGGWVDDPEGEGCYEIKTWWRSLEDVSRWIRSADFRAAHAGRPPKGLFSRPNQLIIHEIVTSTDLDG